MNLEFASGRAPIKRRGDLWISHALITGIAPDQPPQLERSAVVVPVYCGGFFSPGTVRNGTARSPVRIRRVTLADHQDSRKKP